MLNRIIAGLLFVLTAIGATAAVSVTPGSPKWDDASIQFYWAATGPTAPAATAVTNGSSILGMGFTAGGIGTEKAYGSCQFSHGIVASNASTYLVPHLHVSPATALTAGQTNIAFTMIFDVMNIGGKYNGPYTVTSQIGLNASGNTPYNNIIDLGNFTNFFPTLSGIFRCTVVRATASSNVYAGTVILDSADIHYQKDSLGSNKSTSN